MNVCVQLKIKNYPFIKSQFGLVSQQQLRVALLPMVARRLWQLGNEVLSKILNHHIEQSNSWTLDPQNNVSLLTVSVSYSSSYLKPLQVCQGCSSPLCSGSSTDPVGNLVPGLQHTKSRKAYLTFICNRLACLTTVSTIVISLTNYSVHAETDRSFLFMSQFKHWLLKGPASHEWKGNYSNHSCLR